MSGKYTSRSEYLNISLPTHTSHAMKKGRKGIGKTLDIVILGGVVGLVVVFIASTFTSGIGEKVKNILGMGMHTTLDDNIYAAECQELCSTEYDIYKCTASPDGSDKQCGAIFARIRDAGEDLPLEPTSDYGTITLNDDGFLPCSVMTVTFKNIKPEEIADFSVKIENQSGGIVPIRDASGGEITPSGDDYLLCSLSTTPCTPKVEFKLPCNFQSEVEKFIPGVKHTITFTSSNADGNIGETDTLKLSPYKNKKWSCLKDATILGDVKFNQKTTISPETTKVHFKKEITGTSPHMIADVKIEIETGSGQCEDPTIGTPTPIPGCELGRLIPSGTDYEFTMPRVTGELEGILFKILLNVDDEIPGPPDRVDIPLCTAKVHASMTCTGEHRVANLCYIDNTDSKEYILTGLSDSGTHSLDGICKYEHKTEYESYCVNVVDGSKCTIGCIPCTLPQKIMRINTMIDDPTKDKCKFEDLEIVDIFPCKTVTDCDKNTIFTATDSQGWISVDIKNNGDNDFEFDEDNLHITINGNPETVVTAVHIIPSGGTVTINDITATTMKSGSNLVEGAYTVVARIDNLDTLKYPLVDEAKRNANNMLTKQIKVYPACCSDCTSCSGSAACSGCSDMCKWNMNEVTGVNECIRK